eukprot:TRINITY_DN57423_c0_g1_i1.p1 TRINITY_DN57423_c0_g1~~TRINITY_DN57423_c0_g1_i1.p1  ORF type:complete len:338 (+),score=14.95 TRINITY_DN57423_c0_g1_i1:184-1197(+)
MSENRVEFIADISDDDSDCVVLAESAKSLKRRRCHYGGLCTSVAAKVLRPASHDVHSPEALLRHVVKSEPPSVPPPYVIEGQSQLKSEAAVAKPERELKRKAKMEDDTACEHATPTHVTKTVKAKRAPSKTNGSMCRTRALFRARQEEQGRNSSTTGAGSRPAEARPSSTPDHESRERKDRLTLGHLSAMLSNAGVARSRITEIEASVGIQALSDHDRCRWRSIVWNLRRNPKLLDDVNSGAVSCLDLLSMSHEELASSEVQERRTRLQCVASSTSLAQDHSTFAMQCETCGSEDARGFMVHLSAGPFDNHRDSWSQMVIRGNCPHCAHTWVEGREW